MAERPLMHVEVLRQKTLGLHPAYRDSPIRLGEDDIALLKRVNGQATVSTLGGLLRLSDEVLVRTVLRLVARRKLVFSDELPWFDETALLAAVLTRVEGRASPKELHLDDVDQALLEAVDGETRVRELVKRVPLDRTLALVNVLRLVHAGVVRVNRSARPGPPRATSAAAGSGATTPAAEPRRGARAVPAVAEGELAVATEDAPEPSTDEVWGRAPASVGELFRRRVPRRWVAFAMLVVGLVVAWQVARGLLATVETHLAGRALTVDGLTDVIDLAEIKIRAGRRWTGIAHRSFAELSRAERVRAAQELVRRVRAAGFREAVVEEEGGAPLFDYSGGVLSIHEPRDDPRGKRD